MLSRIDVQQCVTAVHMEGHHSNDRRRVLAERVDEPINLLTVATSTSLLHNGRVGKEAEVQPLRAKLVPSGVYRLPVVRTEGFSRKRRISEGLIWHNSSLLTGNSPNCQNSHDARDRPSKQIELFQVNQWNRCGQDPKLSVPELETSGSAPCHSPGPIRPQRNNGFRTFVTRTLPQRSLNVHG